MFKVNKIFVHLHFLSLYRNDFVSKRPVVSWCCGNDVIQKTPHTPTQKQTIFFPITASRAKILTSRGAVKSHIPSTNFAFSRILHYISVNSWIPGKRSLATKLCPSQVSFENYQSNIVCLLLFLLFLSRPVQPLETP